jgi:FkbM family methyltransferase
MLFENIDSTVETILKPIHSQLSKFNPREQLFNEIPEQIMAVTHIHEDDCVLELGGSIGRNSCVINTILKDKSKHVVVEPSPVEYDKLLKNRDNHALAFHIEHSAISSVPLFSKGWLTFTTQVPGSIPVNTITYDKLLEKYDLSFNVLVIDNEGNFAKTLKDYPNILNGIRLLIIEHDFNTIDDLNYFIETLTKNGLSLKTQYLKTSKYGPGRLWGDGLREDPIFVSAWERV